MCHSNDPFEVEALLAWPTCLLRLLTFLRWNMFTSLPYEECCWNLELETLLSPWFTRQCLTDVASSMKVKSCTCGNNHFDVVFRSSLIFKDNVHLLVPSCWNLFCLVHLFMPSNNIPSSCGPWFMSPLDMIFFHSLIIYFFGWNFISNFVNL